MQKEAMPAEKQVYEFISKQKNDFIVEWKTCKISGKPFAIFQSDVDFYDKISPVFDGEKFAIPTPTLCPEERFLSRCLRRNEMSLYRRKCDATNKSIISIHQENAKFPVYDSQYRRSDNWDAMHYGINIDLSKTFFEQFGELHAKVPQIAIMNDNKIKSENCQYCQDFALGKNCYLVNESRHIKDSYYCFHCDHVENLIDCASIYEDSANLYECTSCQGVYQSSFLQNSENCSDCHFGLHLKNCKHCFACTNLNNKSYCIRNKQYSKEDYFLEIKKNNLGSYKNLEDTKKQFQKFLKEQPRPPYYQRNCHNSIGHALFNCKNTIGYGTFNAQDSKYVYNSDTPIDSQDSQGGKYQLNYQCMTCDNSYLSICSNWCWSSKFVYYSDNCHNCENIFGCIGLKNKKYCIFNKQYTKEDYEKLVAKIIEKMMKDKERGEYFPAKLSPFAYNETTATRHFLLDKSNIINRGYKRMDKNYSLNIPDGIDLLKNEDIADDIQNISESILKKGIICPKSGKLFRILPEELEFYRKFNLPIPRLHPEIRQIERWKNRASRNLYIRECNKCKNQTLSNYSIEKVEIIYCEQCYNKEIYG